MSQTNARKIEKAEKESDFPAQRSESGALSSAMLERVGMINRIQTALRSTLNIEDLYSIVLATLISRSSFDFSRVMLTACDEGRGSLTGLAALGAPNRREHERLQQEVEAEEAALATMVKDLEEIQQEPGEEESIFQRSLTDLSNHSFWITTYQKFSAANELQDRVREIDLPLCPELPEQLSFLRRVFDSPHALIVSPEELERTGMPEKLRALLPGESLWKAVRTQKGLRMLIIVDKLYQDAPLQPLDVLHVDWFAGQVAMGLENAEMFQDLKLAYKELQDLDRMKSNFLATISHELRTPLTAINGYLQLLLGNKLGLISPGQREVLERVIEHSEMLTGKVNDLIEIAEMDMGHEAPEDLAPIDPLNALIASMHKIESRRARKSVIIEPIVDHAIPRIRANVQSIERIFFHLLDNAVKFSRPEGRVRVRFAQKNGFLSISVSDNGIGISEEKIQRIFDAFYQIDNQLTRSYEGMGIGLSIIKRHLDQTGGKIEVVSQPGRGSTFTVIYPLA